MQDFKQQVALIIIIVTIVLIFVGIMFIVSLLHYRKKRKLASIEQQLLKEQYENQIMQACIETQEDTMESISREIHDNVGQLLNSTKLIIGVIEQRIDNEELIEPIEVANESLGKAINELRSLSKSLNKEWLSQFNLIENLKKEQERLARTHKINIELTYNQEPKISNDKQLILFRITQEAIQNTIKHSNAQVIKINLNNKPNILEMSIVDDGKGFEINHYIATNGLGLKSMENRTNLCKGQFQIKSQINIGTEININIPIE